MKGFSVNSKSKKVVYVEMIDQGVEVIYFNQPEKKNAISAVMMDLLANILSKADGKKEVKVIILRGVGDTFSSGGDLDQISSENMTPRLARETYRHYIKAIKTLRTTAKPVIAMVDGYAVGGAFSLVLASDLVCASTRAVFVPAFCQIGIIPEMGMMKFLPDLVGAQRAKEILFLGGKISAQRLFDWGLCNRLVKACDLEGATLNLARSVAAMPDMSIQITKGLLNSLTDNNLETCLEAESTASPFCTTIDAYVDTVKSYSQA